MKKLILIFVLLMFVSCVKPQVNTNNDHNFITFINKSNTVLYTYPDYRYPNTDSYKDLDPNKLKVNPQYKVNSNESNTRALTAYNWESAYEPINTKSGIIMFYVFDAKTYDEKGWDYIKTNNLVLKRYDLTLQDLKNSNWTITYDGN